MSSPRAGSNRGWRALFGLLLVLGLADVAGHLFLGNMAQVQLYQRNPPDGRCFGLQPGAQVEYTGWWTRIAPVLLDVNPSGYRGPELPTDKAPGEFRIAMLGDSFVYGQVVEATQTIPAHLQVELGLPVMNFGIPGLALEDQPEQLRLFVRRWQPDLVLLMLTGNDLEPSLCASASQFPPGWLLADFRLFRLGYMAWRRLGPSPDFGDGPARAQRSLEALKQEGATIPARVAGVVIQLPEAGSQPAARRPPPRPPPPGGGPPPPVVAPAPTATSPLWSVLKSDPWLDATAWTEGEAHLENVPGEGHFTGAANQEAARQIAVWLRSQGLLPL